MRLSTLVKFLVILYIGVAVTLGSAILINKSSYEQSLDLLAISQNIKITALKLSILGAEYAVNHREIAAIQWLQQREKLSKLQADIQRHSTHLPASLVKLMSHYSTLDQSFARLKKSLSVPYSSASAKKQAVSLYTGQLLNDLQRHSLYAEHFIQESLSQTRSALFKGHVLIGVAALLILVGLVSSVYVVYKYFILPGQLLKEAISTIEEGNLNYRLKQIGPQEFQEIGSEFNQMLDSLERSTKAHQLASFGHWEWDIASGDISWSDSIFTLFGFAPQSFKPSYESFLKSIHPQDRDSVELAVKEAVDNNTSYAIEHRIVLPNGSIKTVKEQGKIELDEMGQPVRMIGTVQDISQEQEIKKALEASETLYKQMFDMNTAMKLLIDPATGNIIRANDSACAFYGYPRDELTQMSIFDINMLDSEQVQREMKAAKQEDRRFFRFKHQLSDGSIRDVEVHSGPVEVEGQSLLYSIIIDVDDRNRYEAELKETSKLLSQERREILKSQQQYKTLFESVSVGIVQQNQAGDIVAANDQACKILSLSREQLLTKNSVDPDWQAIRENGSVFEGESHPAMLALATGEPQLNVTMGLKYPEQTLWISIDSIPLLEDGAEKPYSVITSFSDITDRLVLQRALEQSEYRNELAQKLYGMGIWQFDAETGEVYWSSEMYEMWGVKEDEFEGNLEAVERCIHPDDREKLRSDAENAIATGSVHELEFRLLMPNGEIKWVYSLGKPIIEQGQYLGMYGISTDVTEKHDQLIKLNRAASVFDHAQEGIIITDVDGVIVEINQAFTDITGYTKEQAIGQTPKLLKSGRQSDTFYQKMWSELSKNGHWEGELWNRSSSGEPYAESLTISAVRDQQGNLMNYVGVFSDITAKKLREERLEKRANYDPLTNLPNRHYLRSSMAMKCGNPLESGLALLFIDLDGFKAVNDTYGHSVGDELLIAVSKRIHAQLREEDIVARIGGDEFILLANNVHSIEEVQKLADRVLNACATNFALEPGDVSVSSSIGAVFVSEQKVIKHVEDLIDQADEAMYEAKRAGKNRVVITEAQ